ncbi:helix-turn-helix domain-containing protein [Sporomusa sphaeroides]|uniref:Helix-turn-helix protein n=1 Tax=Sporomusa sphaeroides DSM 2875 TaxID=1337886 RepID=A0ABP2C6F3_9FIRM|nr:helix-turn-helix transcriptional regulator [Sporomusa sphaeroides]OLS56170.1 helix-turn-helix protein [Sporomusa sphaeroides DSM 2875]CVK19188.1 helix-turn-helix protein [Sporomusa sphaeroides DSM 2875]
MSDINSRIKELRLKLNMTQEEFGNKIGLSKSGISNIESGTRSVRERHIKLISSIFNVSEDWLKNGKNSVWSSYDELHKDSLGKLKGFEKFINYLESVGYAVKYEKSGQSEAGYYEEQKDDEGNIVGEPSFIPDEEYFDVILIKGGVSTTYTDSEFKEFQQACEKSIDYQVWLKNNK